MTIDETRQFDFVVPDDGLPSLVGKTIHFTVTLTMGSKVEPCPLDDSLALKFGKETFAELKAMVYQTACSKLDLLQKSQINSAIGNFLVTNHDVKVPNWLASSEAKYLAQQSKKDWDALLDIDKAKFMELATNNVKLSLILDKIRDDEPEAQLSDKEVLEIVKQNVMRSQPTENIQELLEKMNSTGYLQILFSRIKDEFVLDFITKTIKVVD
jgi:FKBP-type peptidyl-prolyl cis-trans isomerase (trigger factor)